MSPSQDDSSQATGPLIARVIAAVTILAALLAILGQTYTNGREAGQTQDRLDRNCRILISIEADQRFLITQHAAEGTNGTIEAQAFREIFKNAHTQGCGG
jgi:hypothetical protein